METQKVIYVNQSNGNKPATINERVKFLHLEASKNVDLSAHFTEAELKEATYYHDKKVEASKKLYKKSSDIVRAVVRTSFEIVKD